MPHPRETLDDKQIKALIRKNTFGIGKDTPLEIHEKTGRAPLKLQGVRLFSSAFRFNFDPVPYDHWILDGKRLYPGSRALEVLKRKKIVPGSGEEAADIARYVLFATGEIIDTGRRMDELSSTVKDGLYEVKLRVTTDLHPRGDPGESVFFLRIGKGVYESGTEQPGPGKPADRPPAGTR